MTTIKLRRDIASNWNTVNPILAEGEVGIETDTNRTKIGDGATAWNDLAYQINFDCFTEPLRVNHSSSNVTWDDTKLSYDESTKIFTPLDSVSDGSYETKHPVTITIPNSINIDSYSDDWSITIPNAVFTQSSNNTSNLICVEVYAENNNKIVRLWYGASAWRLGATASTGNVGNPANWGIKHSTTNTPSGTSVIAMFDPINNNISKDYTLNSSSGRISKVIVYVNSQMNTNVPIGNIVLNKLDTSGNETETYPLFATNTQSEISLAFNPNNLKINASNQLDTTADLANFITGINSTDVTTALGYTPLNKAGDTATGTMTFNSSVNISGDTSFIMTGVTKGTNPASYTYKSMQFVDKNNSSTWYNSRLGIMEYTLGSNGDSYIALGTYPNTSGSTDVAVFYVGWKNNQKYCEFPNTICVDGRWVSSSSNIVTSSSSTALPTTDNLTYDLSNYLPADASTYDYEVAIEGVVYSGNTSGDRSFLILQGKITETICVTIARSNTSYRQGGFGILPINHQDRTLTIKADANNTGTFSLNLRGYRRLGTNA